MANDYLAKPNPTSQQPPYQQQTAPQQQASPYKAPDMSSYQPYTGPRTPPKNARTNDLSGQVPSNQIWGQAYNQASNQYGGNTQAQSWTMPGSYSTQGYNPTTGQYGQPTGGQSWDGNMAYNAIDQRPGPIQASATGVGGNPMQWQDSLAQREAFVGNLSDRLNQYTGGQLTGPVAFDPNQLLGQANDQLANGTFYNPFGQQNPDVQRAMGGASQFATGTQWQNPFGPQANTPSFGVGGQPPVQNTSNPNQTAARSTASPPQSESQRPPSGPFMPSFGVGGQPPVINTSSQGQPALQSTGSAWTRPESPIPLPQPFNPGGTPQYANPPSPAPSWVTPGAAQPKPSPSQGTTYNPTQQNPSLPPVDPIKSQLDSQKRAEEYRAKNNISLPRSEPTQEDLYRQHPNLRPKQDYTNMRPIVDYDLETGKAVNPNKTQADYRADRAREQERSAVMDLRGTGQGTPENVAGVRKYFSDLNRAKQNPSQYQQAPVQQPRSEAPPSKRGAYTRTPMPWRAR